ncbi:TRAP transporter substrate-binding protein [Treponema primitia]|uniref:TRAP transporter substrate-binding protein n=1 Tax=Treponema primitia TaxID=88058 RepID=UPI0002555738|nr:TRAP transporter substrate-binding protein [Treponema primitia]
MSSLKKTIAVVGTVVLLTVLFVSCNGKSGQSENASGKTVSGPEYNFNIGFSPNEESINYAIATKAKELMEQKSNGRVTMTVYPNSQLGKDRETIEGTIAGNVDFVLLVTPLYVDFVPAVAVFDLPNIFPDLETARKTLDGPALPAMQAAFEQYGLKLFSFSDAGFREMSTSKPVRSIADFTGQKIRVMENKNHIEYWRSLGANPTPMDFAEVYISLQQKTIDAQENPYDLIITSKFYEVQNAVVETNHILHILTPAMNLARYNSLPADVQKIVADSIDEATKYGRQVADQRIAGYKQTIRDNKNEIITIPEDMRLEIVRRSQSVVKMVRDQIGDQLVDQVLAAVESVSK